MKKLLFKFSMIALCLTSSATAFSQSAGTLTFTYTPTSHSGYSGTKNVLAVWIQTGAGGFVKTKLRHAGGNTSDHLPTWASNSGGSASNCLSGSCNVVSATTGATLSNFTQKTITWDGTDTGSSFVTDGTYQVTIQSTWNHGSSGTASRSFTFTKGPNSDIQTPTDDVNFTGISLQWIPSGAGIDENAVELTDVSVYPNPSTDGVFNVDYKQAKSVTVYNVLGVAVVTESLEESMKTKSLNLSNCTNGVYFVYVSDGIRTSKHMVVLNQ